MKKSHTIGYLFGIATVVMWAPSAAVGKLVLGGLDFLQLTFLVMLFSLISIVIIAATQNKLATFFRYSPRDHLYIAIIGFIGYFLYQQLYFLAVHLLPAQTASILDKLWPIMLVVWLAILLKERFTLLSVGALFLSFTGVVIISTNGNLLHLQLNPWGVMSAVSAAVLYGLFSALTKKYHYDIWASAVGFSLVSCVASFIVMMIFSELPHPTTGQWLGALWLGVVAQSLATATLQYALRRGNAAMISNLVFLTPFLSLVCVSVLVGEKILVSSVVGLVVIILGIFLQMVFGKKRPAEHRQQQ